MAAWLIAAILVHLASIASLYPSLALQISQETHLWIFAGIFPLMAITSLVHSHLRNKESSAANLATYVAGLGVTHFGIFLLARFDLSFGVVDPFGAREQAEFLERVGWYVGFSAIFLVGNTFLVARPISTLTDALLRPLRAAPMMMQFVVILILGAVLGMLAMQVVGSEQASELAARFNTQLDENPTPIILGAIAIPAVLQMVGRAFSSRRKR